MTELAAPGGTLTRQPADELRERLDDPAVAAALAELLNHAGLLAMLVGGLDGFVRRSEVISDSLAEGIGELRAGVGGRAQAVDLAGLASGLAALSAAAKDILPLLDRLLASQILSAQAVDAVSLLAGAVVEGHQQATERQTSVAGVRALLGVLRDRDVARGLGLLTEIARALGRSLRAGAEAEQSTDTSS
ncbi:MAG: DUF1641 domain-containing protein [Frankia sp.]|nr:DUF1641 domain-containing protein [Frankia sp.]